LSPEDDADDGKTATGIWRGEFADALLKQRLRVCYPLSRT